MLSLVSHSIKSFFRGGMLGGGIAVKLFAALMGFYFLVMAVVLSIVLPDLLRKMAEEGQTLIDVTAQFAIYFLVFDLITRFFMQSLKGIKLHYYILLPFPLKKLIGFMLARSQFNFLNLLTLIIIIPFSIRGIASDLGTWSAIFWLIGFLGLMLGNSLWSVYLKLIFSGNLKASLVMIGVLIALALTGVNEEVLAIASEISTLIFNPLLSTPLAVLLWLSPVLAWWLSFKYLVANKYQNTESGKATFQDSFWSILEWQGQGNSITSLTAMEWKLMLRHKRTRNLLLFSFIFLFYGFIFYKDAAQFNGMTVFAGIFITGFAAFNYGQYLGAWEGRYFDGIFSRNFRIEDYFHAKFRLIFLLLTLSFIPSLLYGFMDVRYLYLHVACYVYNLGINSFVLMFIVTYQRKSLDLNAGSALNYQGVSALQFIAMLPLIAFPVLMFVLVDLVFSTNTALIVVSATGVLGLLLYPMWISGISENFREKKYLMATGFRKKSG